MICQQYQNSEVEWIGDIPAHWKVKPLFTLFEEVKSKNTGNIENNVLSLSYGSIIKRDVDSNYGLLPDSFESYNRIIEGDIVLRLTDLQNDKKSLRCGYVKEKGIITSAYVTIRKRVQNLNSQYYYYLLHAYDIKKIFYNLGAGVRQSMGYSDLKKIPILLPSFEEQQQIVQFLNKSIPNIDILIKQKEAFIKLLEEKLQLIITEAVIKGLNSDVKMKDSGVEWIGEIPEHWNLSKVKYISDVVGRIGFRGYTVEDLVSENEGALVLGATQINTRNKIDLTTKQFLSWEKYYESPEIMLEKDDLLIVQRGSSIGKVALIKDINQEMTINPTMMILKRITINQKYLYWFFNSKNIQSFIQTLTSTTAIPMISQHQVENFYVPIPGSKEMELIVASIDKKATEIESIIDIIMSQIQKLKDYRQSLIYEAVTGKIDVCNFEVVS